MNTYTVKFTQNYQIIVDADSADEAEQIAIGTPLDSWEPTGEDITTEEGWGWN